MTVQGICLDGRWTKRQVDRILDIIGRDNFLPIEVTTHEDQVKWFAIISDEDIKRLDRHWEAEYGIKPVLGGERR